MWIRIQACLSRGHSGSTNEDHAAAASDADPEIELHDIIHDEEPAVTPPDASPDAPPDELRSGDSFEARFSNMMNRNDNYST